MSRSPISSAPRIVRVFVRLRGGSGRDGIFDDIRGGFGRKGHETSTSLANHPPTSSAALPGVLGILMGDKVEPWRELVDKRPGTGNLDV